MNARKVSVERRFRRSIRIDADQADAAEGFIWTPTAERAIEVLAEHVDALEHSAFTWTGTYGCGKSSLATLVAASLAADAKSRRKLLAGMPSSTAANLKRAFWKHSSDWAVVPVVGRRDEAAAVITASYDAVCGRSSEPLLNRLSRRAEGGKGTLIIVDEMGKLLEAAAGAEGDAYFFQELAELANRSGGLIVIIGILHQAFDDYSARLSRDARDEWLKIQGRFVDVPLSPTGWEQIELLSKAIVAKDVPDTRQMAAVVADAMLGQRSGSQRLTAQLSACSPISPVTAALLGPLSKRRFGQNQRSLFGFLGSAEPSGFQDFLLHPERELYEPSLLWSYLRANLESSILASPDGHRWSVAIDAVERAEAQAADDLALRTLKTIALIDMFRERSGMVASESVIAAAIPDARASSLEDALATLLSLSVIVFRKHLGGYSLYAGSDFDIEASIDAARRDLGACDFSRLKSSGVLAPMLAKRHYHETGAMRWFEVEVVTIAEALVVPPAAPTGAAGYFLLVVNDEALSQAALRSRMARVAAKLATSPCVLGSTSQSYLLREMTLDLAALEHVQSSDPQLKGDAIARREVSSRISRLSMELEERVRDALSFASWSVPALPELVIEPNSIKGDGSAGLSRIASLVADGLYPRTPRLRNELLNRSRPSSNAMAALRALMTAMVKNGRQPNLGIADYPPEMGHYISLLQRTGLHVAESAGEPFMAPTEGDDAKLAAVWVAADELLDKSGSEGLTLADIQARWAERPFGIKAGLLPLLSLAHLLSRLRHISVYLDGLFCSTVNDLLVDRMLQEPKSVRLRLSVISAKQIALLQSVGHLLAEIDGDPTPVSSEPLDLARRLVGFVTALPTWVRRTSRLDPISKAVRDLATAAHDPNRFMLDDLPTVLEKDPRGAVEALSRGLSGLAVAYGDLLSSLSSTMLDELGVGPSREDLDVLRSRARTVVGITGNFRLDAFATRLATFDRTQGALEGILSLAANRPPRDWTDREVDAARTELAALAQEFLRAEGFAHVHGRVSNRTSMALFISDPSRPSLMRTELTVDANERAKVQLLAAKLKAALGGETSIQTSLAVIAELGAQLLECQLSADQEMHEVRGAA
jgi:hypothetical protein